MAQLEKEPMESGWEIRAFGVLLSKLLCPNRSALEKGPFPASAGMKHQATSPCWDDGKSNTRAGLLSMLRCTAKALQCARYLQDGELQVVANWNTCPGTAHRCSCLGEQPQHEELTEAAAFREEGPRLEHPIWQDLEALKKEDAHTS